jgi:hypothetical protein
MGRKGKGGGGGGGTDFILFFQNLHHLKKTYVDIGFLKTRKTLTSFGISTNFWEHF